MSEKLRKGGRSKEGARVVATSSWQLPARSARAASHGHGVED